MNSSQDSPQVLQSRLEQLKADLALVAELFSTFGHSLDFNNICREVVHVVWEMTGGARVRLSYRSHQGGWGAITLVNGREESAIPTSPALARRLVAEVKPLILVGNTGESGLDSYLGLPLVHAHAVTGTLEIENLPTPHRIQDHLRTLRVVADTAALAMSNARLVEQTTSAARTEERYRALIEAGSLMGEAIGVIQNTGGVEGAHLFTNEEWSRITGYTQEELARISFLAVIHPRDREDVASVVRQMLQGEQVRGRHEVTAVSKDGREVPIEIVGTPITYQGKPAVVGFARDITDRKRAETETKRRQEYIETILSSSMDLVLTFKKDGTVSYANKALSDVLGYKFERIKGKHFLEFIPRDMRGYMQQKWEEIQTGVGGVYETKVIKADGSIADCLVSHSSLEGFDEYLAVIKDITERKRHEEELLALTSRLVNAQEDERRFVAKELHDQVGQCITGLKLSIESVQRVPPEQAACKLEEARTILDELMTQVRSLSLELRPPMLDDLGLLPALMWHFERYTSRTGVRVVLQHHRLEVDIPGNVRVAAYRIIQEALTNVARYAGVKEAFVNISTGRGLVHLEVEDHGVGFDPRATMMGRVCCGLTGMRERAIAIGGRLTIEPAPGSGTRVVADLPQVQRSDTVTRRRVAKA
ncbi:MAG: PAS domain S-box protein [Chloroflexi bacterium]|nr:PAS domain S-box protein [Chloroflexota bacterium]